MPDWFYRTISRPVLFQLPARRARDIALGFMGALARLPLGPRVIDFMGHMRPDDRLRCTHFGMEFGSPIGLGPYLDSRACALPALARFGFGFIEIGPITANGDHSGPSVDRLDDLEALRFGSEGLNEVALSAKLTSPSRIQVPLMLRLASKAPPDRATEDVAELIRKLAPVARLFSLGTISVAVSWSAEQWKAHVDAIRQVANGCSSRRPVLLCVPADLDASRLPHVEAALAAGFDGLLVDGSIADKDGTIVGAPVREAALHQVRMLRNHFANIPIVAGGGIHEPRHALEFRAAGADLVQMDSGLVFTGPGLPKRTNELLLWETAKHIPPPPQTRAAEMSWFWTLAMGGGMLLGSVLALAFAATVVVLPYDLNFIGLTLDELNAINPRLLQFMAHDRVSLAGTMVATGAMYVGLSYHGIRRGYHWAQMTVFVSAFTGFASFFLFLGFGYLDPFHAFVTAVLLQLLLLGVKAKLGIYTPVSPPESSNDRVWRMSQWGQLVLIIHAAGLLGAGVIISFIGVTSVFVPEDLAYMGIGAEALREAHPRLVPLIAHDRATFGGMLLASGWAFLLPALWGFRRGESWLWWTYLAAGPVGYICAIGVHFAVGYTDFHHLLPAFTGLSLFLLGLLLSGPHLLIKR